MENLTNENTRQGDPENGALVVRVAPSSAASGKIYRGDIITEVIVSGSRQAIDNADDFFGAVKDLSSGTKIALVGKRAGSRFFIAITID